MLWDIIRDFIVQYITGGTTSHNETFVALIGRGWYEDGSDELAQGADFMVSCVTGFAGDITFKYLSLSDWLATTITAVIMILFVVFAVWLVRWVFKAVSSAFLLK